MGIPYEAEVRVRVRLDADNEAEAQAMLARHVHRMVKYREADTTEVFPVATRPILIETRRVHELD